jgi:nucleotide-binding universal stress UspA family protein
MFEHRHVSPDEGVTTGADRRPLGRNGRVDHAFPGNLGQFAPAGPADSQKIVVGYDGSEAAKRALARASSLVSGQTQVVVVAVAEPYPRSGVTIPANHDLAEIRRRRRELHEARASLSRRGIEAETVLARGKAAEILVEASKDADLVVVGSRKLTRIQQLILRSVSSKVVDEAACDVLVVR